MVDIIYSLFDLKRQIKPSTYLLIALAMFTLLIPGLFNIQPDWNPQSSINSSAPYGKSGLQTYLTQQGYAVRQQYSDITAVAPAPDMVLVLDKPTLSYTAVEIQYLTSFLNAGGNILMLGQSVALNDLAKSLPNSLVVLDPNSPIYDFFNNGGRPAEPIVTGPGFAMVSVTPYELTPAPSQAIVIQTSASSESLSCIKIEVQLGQSNNCQSPKTIGIISASPHIGRIADNWFVSNTIAANFTVNYAAFTTILSQYGSISKVVFDETHLDWAYYNQHGIANHVDRLLKRPETILILLSIMTIILPILLSYSGGVLRTSLETQRNYTKRLSRRLQKIQLDNPVVPLSQEEQFLVDNQMQLRQRKGLYFNYLASQYLNYLSDAGLIEHMSKATLAGLTYLQQHPVSNDHVWILLQQVKREIIQAREAKSAQHHMEVNS